MQGEAEINRLLARVALLWQMLQSAERLLEIPPSLGVCRPRQGLLSCLPAVCQGLVPHLPTQGMMGQTLDLLAHPLPRERLQGLDNVGMQGAPTLSRPW